MEEERKTPAHVELTKDAGEQAEKTGGLIAPGMIKSASVTIAETEIPLWYDLRAQIQIEEELEMSYDTLRETINNLKNPLNTKTVIQAIRILGNRGLAKNGEKVRLTDEWLYDHVRQPDMLAYKIALLGALTAGWYMETDDSTQGEIDLGLMEIRKKKEKMG